VKQLLESILAIATKTDLQNFLIQEDLMNGDAFFNFGVSPDMKNSKKMAAYLRSGGIGLPERDYYLKADAKSVATRQRYSQHIVAMLVLSGWEAGKAKKAADGILAVETELAKATLTKEDRRDPHLQYNKMSRNELVALVPSINWTSYFLALGVKEDSIIVSEPAFLKSYERIVGIFPMEEIKNYLRWTVLRKAAPFLSHVFVQESFDFNAHYLSGIDQLMPRWKRVLEVSENYLGEAIGRLYVAEVFPPEAKKKAQEMVENIKFAFAERIKQLDWMSDSTKMKA
jgi:putative endopeptidase